MKETKKSMRQCALYSARKLLKDKGLVPHRCRHYMAMDALMNQLQSADPKLLWVIWCKEVTENQLRLFTREWRAWASKRRVYDRDRSEWVKTSALSGLCKFLANYAHNIDSFEAKRSTHTALTLIHEGHVFEVFYSGKAETK